MAMDSGHRFAQQLKKGVLEMLVLQLLLEQPGHGYALIVRLRKESAGLLDLKEGTLYPILYRLEQEEYISSVWNTPDGTASGKIPRRIYTVTEKGRQLLQQEAEIWHQFVRCVDQQIGRNTV